MAWGVVSDPVSRALNRVYNGTRMPLSGIEIRFAGKPSYRESSFFFYDCELLSSFVFLLLLFVKREKKEQFECLAKIDDFLFSFTTANYLAVSSFYYYCS